ncbi:ABC transporter ATP-binding protein [Desulforamulus aeronauticus]|uniref:Peptide/nickel transport system ATP-binding protein n=1 Tax=Desulforamulus aeronauticus DSM 10349 TaxID=1121421 RepID=A0A1M6VHE4_9FIRM|nr:ABC transporter ATP-binding protein [Desulforamulus aeronauticus]SHK80879.1 peptide/nickel transport system ATP-binding protein [Desulforamulus aeronauticus DSM 10349]
MTTETLLQVKDLKTHFFLEDGVVPAVDGVSFHLNRGETLAVVGESGSGKSITATSIMRLIPNPPGKIVGGEILFNGQDLLRKTEKEMRDIRGNRISMIFQEPMTSLNPVFRVGYQISESLMIHQGLNKKDALEKSIEMLRLTGIPSPEKRVHDFPHQMSGGMRQRVMIAMALCCRPELLIADEPTTALDVTIQAQILDLMLELKEQMGTAIIMITHDLAVVAEVADRAVVMYCGKLVEESTVLELFDKPLHPYTKGLLKSIPHVNSTQEKLYMIDGMVPPLTHLPAGCAFAPRCPEAQPRCHMERPMLREISPGRRVSCWLYEGGGE